MDEHSYDVQVQSKEWLSPMVRIEGDQRKGKKIVGKCQVGKLLLAGSLTSNASAFDHSFKVETGSAAKVSYTLKSKNTLSHTLTMNLKKAVLSSFLNSVKVPHF